MKKYELNNLIYNFIQNSHLRLIQLVDHQRIMVNL